MRRFVNGVLAASITYAFVGVNTASSQQVRASVSPTGARARAMAQSFNKSKHVVKQKHGISRDKYKDVRSEPVIESNPQNYWGTYEVPDFGLFLHLRVDSNGSAAATGEETDVWGSGVTRRFTLANAKVEGALLTGTKVYADGRSESLEGVFINRTSSDSPTATGVTVFGLGVLGAPIRISGITVEKFFYERKR